MNPRKNVRKKYQNQRREKRIREKARRKLEELCAVAAICGGEPGDKTFWEWCGDAR